MVHLSNTRLLFALLAAGPALTLAQQLQAEGDTLTSRELGFDPNPDIAVRSDDITPSPDDLTARATPTDGDGDTLQVRALDDLADALEARRFGFGSGSGGGGGGGRLLRWVRPRDLEDGFADELEERRGGFGSGSYSGGGGRRGGRIRLTGGRGGGGGKRLGGGRGLKNRLKSILKKLRKRDLEDLADELEARRFGFGSGGYRGGGGGGRIRLGGGRLGGGRLGGRLGGGGIGGGRLRNSLKSILKRIRKRDLEEAVAGELAARELDFEDDLVFGRDFEDVDDVFERDFEDVDEILEREFEDDYYLD